MSQQKIIDRAHHVLPGGGFGNFSPDIIIREGNGSHVWDENGREYIDFLIGSGPMILGHNHPEITRAVSKQLERGTTFFANNTRGIELAEDICEAVHCAEQVRFVSTGSEADMYAMRLARAATGRDKILKFEGGYHGMSAEAQMSLAPNKLVNFPIAVSDSGGIPDSVGEEILVAPYNDIHFTHSIVGEFADQIAAIIVEPLQRIIPPQPGFLESLREECDKHNIVLIFDEVVTGFRFAYGGAQEHYGVVPDICTLGKVIGGGFPLAAIAGKTEIMDYFDHTKVGKQQALMQIGTLSGNPIAAVAGLKTLEILRYPGQYDKLHAIGARIMEGIREILTAEGHTVQVSGHPAMFDVIFTDRPILNYRDVTTGDASKAALFNDGLRERGIFRSPGKMYISLALTDDDIDHTLNAVQEIAQII